MMLQFPEPGTPARRLIMKETVPRSDDLLRCSVPLPPRPRRQGEEPVLAEILWCVSAVTGVPIPWLKSVRRGQMLSRTRWLYFWLARTRTSSSYPKIARFCGGRDHSTIIHGVREVAAQWDTFGPLVETVAGVLDRGVADENL